MLDKNYLSMRLMLMCHGAESAKNLRKRYLAFALHDTLDSQKLILFTWPKFLNVFK
jgi:hypothetical protein